MDPEVADTLGTAGFLAHACGGLLVCTLQVAGISRVEAMTPGTFRFTTSLTDSLGDPFRLGPCCGEEGDPVTEFTFEVRKADDRFLVESLPIYVP